MHVRQPSQDAVVVIGKAWCDRSREDATRCMEIVTPGRFVRGLPAGFIAAAVAHAAPNAAAGEPCGERAWIVIAALCAPCMKGWRPNSVVQITSVIRAARAISNPSATRCSPCPTPRPSSRDRARDLRANPSSGGSFSRSCSPRRSKFAQSARPVRPGAGPEDTACQTARRLRGRASKGSSSTRFSPRRSVTSGALSCRRAASS